VLDRSPHLLGADRAVHDPQVVAALQQAAAEAYARGRADGADEVRRSAAADAARAADGLRAALADGLQALRAHQAAAADDTLELACEIAANLLGREPSDGGAALAARLLDVLDAVDDEAVTVTVGPAEAETVAIALAGTAGVEVRTDPRLAPGEARVAGRWASADLTRTALLAAVRDALLVGRVTPLAVATVPEGVLDAAA